jgi:hypothetical protein
MNLDYLSRELQQWIVTLQQDESDQAREVLTRLVALRNNMRDPTPMRQAREQLPRIADKLQRIVLIGPARVPEIDRFFDTILAELLEHLT